MAKNEDVKRVQEWRDKNRKQYNEYQRDYMRKWRKRNSK